jgi:hypothetical protein
MDRACSTHRGKEDFVKEVGGKDRRKDTARKT